MYTDRKSFIEYLVKAGEDYLEKHPEEIYRIADQGLLKELLAFGQKSPSLSHSYREGAEATAKYYGASLAYVPDEIGQWPDMNWYKELSKSQLERAFTSLEESKKLNEEHIDLPTEWYWIVDHPQQWMGYDGEKNIYKTVYDITCRIYLGQDPSKGSNITNHELKILYKAYLKEDVKEYLKPKFKRNVDELAYLHQRWNKPFIYTDKIKDPTKYVTTPINTLDRVMAFVIDNTYFIPKPEDLHIGCEYEIYLGGLRSINSPQEWVKVKILSEKLGEIEGRRIQFPNGFLENQLRTLYLTKEQILAEGWTLIKEAIEDNIFKEWRFTGKDEGNHWFYLKYCPITHELEITKKYSVKNEREWYDKTYVLFDGICQDINELRKISKQTRVPNGR